MTVLFVAPSADVVSGLGSWLDTLVPAMVRSGQRGVLGLVSGPVWHRADRYETVHPGLETRRIHTRTCTPEGRCRAVMAAIREVQPDLVVSVHVPDTYRAVSRLRGLGGFEGRCLATIHSFSADVAEDIRRYRTVIDAVGAPNRLLCEVMREVADLPREAVFYAPCGVENGGFDVSGRARQRFFCVGVAGRLEQSQKGVLDAGAAWMEVRRRHPDVRLLVAGTGGDGPALRDLLRDAVKQGTVEFLGALRPADMDRAFYGRVDALLIASASESGPLVAWEAMTRGIPVVSSRYTGSRMEGALVHGETALLFDVGDTVEAARLLARLLADPTLHRILGENGKRLAVGRYSAATCHARWIEVFGRVVALPVRHPSGMGACLHAGGGRLDALFGAALAEGIRRFLPTPSPRVLTDSSAEWPHSHSPVSPAEQDRFLALAEELDRRAMQSV